MMARPVRYLIVGLIVFVIGLVAFLPARVAASWVDGSSGVTLGGVTGTLFSGHAAYAAGPGGSVENLDWTLNPASLLLGSLSADITVDSDRNGFSAVVTRSLFGNTHIDNLTGSASAGWLAKLAGYTFMPLAGDITVDVSEAAFNDDLQVSALDGRLGLGGARWELLNPPLALGQFKAAVDHNDDGVRARITDSEGPLAIKGQITVGEARRYQLDVSLRARAGADDRLGNVLNQLGPADDAGWHRIREQGQL